ncbi:MAG TPA: hypothetical protein GXX29_10915 [Firmicutes bacterium]|nr:hypothetical protein [Bacillota bacterium]
MRFLHRAVGAGHPLGHHVFHPLSLGMFVAIVMLFFTAACSAPAAAFTEHWLYAESEHFYIYFRPEHQEIAARLLAIAEAEHPRVTAWVGHVPEDKAHLIIADESDIPNGQAVYLYRPLTILFPVFPGNYTAYFTGLGPRIDDPLRLLFIHEYTHLVHMDMNRGASTLVRRTFGKVPLLSTPNALQPPLALEGFAVLAETELTTSGRGRDPYYEMFLRTAFLAGKEMRLDQAIGHYPHDFDPAGGPYLYGLAFLQYLSSTYGHDQLREINYSFIQQPYLWGNALRRVLGKDIEELWDDWQNQARRRYAAEAEEVAALGLSELKPLDSRGEYALHPAVAPYGNAVAYYTRGEVHESIRLIGPAGDKELTTAVAMAGGNIAWSPDGTKIYYSRLNGDRMDTEYGDIYYWDLAAGKEKRITYGKRATAPALSPDGHRLLYVSKADPPATRLVIHDLRDGLEKEFQPALALPQEAVIISASYAPDGDRLAVTVWQPGGYTDIYLADLKTGAAQPLMYDQAVDENEAWSPDGRFLFYDSDLSGIYNIYAYDTVTGKHYRLTNVLTGLFTPAPAPDGQSLICSQYTADGFQLASLPLVPSTWMEVSRPLAHTPPQPKPDIYPMPPAKVYSPLTTLAPTYMLPFPDDERTNAVGIFTSGQDVLSTIGYSLSLSYHPQGGFGYKTAFTHLFGRSKQWQLTVQAERVFNNKLIEQQGLSLAYSWGGSRYQQQLAGALLRARAGQNARRPWTPVYLLAWQKASLTGSGTLTRLGLSSVTLTRLPAEKIESCVYTFDNTIYNRRHRFMIKGGAAFAGGAGLVPIGGTNSDFMVRGSGEKSADLLSAGLSGQYELRFPIKKGFADSPVFVAEATAGIFTDVAWTGHIDEKSVTLDLENHVLLASAGLETGIRLYLAYNTPVEVRLGAAKPLTGKEVPWSVYLRFIIPNI